MFKMRLVRAPSGHPKASPATGKDLRHANLPLRGLAGSDRPHPLKQLNITARRTISAVEAGSHRAQSPPLMRNCAASSQRRAQAPLLDQSDSIGRRCDRGYAS